MTTCITRSEKVGAAGNVEQEAVGRIEGDQGRIAVAPIGYLLQEAAVSLRVGLGDV
jgi:hypothetical protein